jgi:hypothetical protein
MDGERLRPIFGEGFKVVSEAINNVECNAALVDLIDVGKVVFEWRPPEQSPYISQKSGQEPDGKGPTAEAKKIDTISGFIVFY